MSSNVAVLVPVKPLERAKTRLATPLPRAALMRAFARDTVDAAARCPAVDVVCVVSDDLEPRRWGVRVLPDRGDGELNTAVERAEAELASYDVLVVLCADLPCLRSDDLAAVLARTGSSAGRWFVPDRQQTGTTVLVARGRRLRPCFGAGSAAAHLASGAAALAGAPASTRQDVDTAEDLQRALELGVGAHTSTLLGELLR